MRIVRSPQLLPVAFALLTTAVDVAEAQSGGSFYTTKPRNTDPTTVVQRDASGQVVIEWDLSAQLPTGFGTNFGDSLKMLEVGPEGTLLCSTGYNAGGGWFELDQTGQIARFYSNPGSNSSPTGAQRATFHPAGGIVGCHYAAGSSQVRRIDAAGNQLWQTQVSEALVPCIVGQEILVGRFLPNPLTRLDSAGAVQGSVGSYRHVFVLRALANESVLVGSIPSDPNPTDWIVRSLSTGSEYVLDTSPYGTPNRGADVDEMGNIWVLCGDQAVRFAPGESSASAVVTLAGHVIDGFAATIAVSGAPLDCNRNGILDSTEINSGASPDCNGNGSPDDCDLASGNYTDCNANGIPDSCDIAAGLELDCNMNGIPDSCDLLAGTSLDCDANGIPDECDIAAGAADCDGDSIPDSCQIAADATLDLNANGTLDACEALGAPYCSPAVTNSTGLPGEVTLLGSELAFFNQFQVSARQLPANAFGYFVCSLAQGPPTTPPFGSQGAICVSGNIGRGVGGGVLNSGPDGFFFGSVNLNAVPQPSGPVAVAPGETWHFQAWYRDANPTVTSNFTDAVAVTFQ